MNGTRAARTIASVASVLALLLAGAVYGDFASKRDLFPSTTIRHITNSFLQVNEALHRPWFLALPAQSDEMFRTLDAGRLAQGLVLLAGIDPEHRPFLRVVARDGTEALSLKPDWFEIWGDVPELGWRAPKAQPGAVLHGIQMLPDGDVVLNFEFLSTMRLSPCGEVVWKLLNFGHHSVDIADDGSIWVGSAEFIESGDSGYANHGVPVDSWTVQRLSPDGEILDTIPVFDLLLENDLAGLLYLSTIENERMVVGGDTLHANDIEVFPAAMRSDVFAPGDVMLSLRNINTVLVFDPRTRRIKWRDTGTVLRHHDPDFVGGNRIIIYDNRNLNPDPGPEAHSRIVEIDALTGRRTTRFRGEGEAAFYSWSMGKQQLLDNGNLMIIASQEGRAIEVAPDGALVWEYNNLVGDGFAGLVTEAMVLPPSMDMQFFADLTRNCG